MSAFLGGFHDAIRAAIGAVWTDTPANGIYHEVEATRLIFGDKVEAGELPYATFRCEHEPGTRWGSANVAYSGRLVIHRIQRDDYDIEALVASMEDLRDYLWGPGQEANLAVGQIVGTPVVRYDRLATPLIQFMVDTLRPYIGAVLWAPYMVGETPDT